MRSEAVLGSRLRQARELAQINQTEAAGVLGMTIADLSQYESGKCRVEALTLESMSRLYRVSLAYFFGEDISLADWEVNLRSAGQTLSGIEKAGLSYLIEKLHQLAQLYQLTETPYPNIPHPPFAPLAESKVILEKVADCASEARRHYHLGIAPLLDLHRFLEARGYNIFAVPLGQQHLSGFFFPHPDLGSIMVLNSDLADTDRPLILARQLAHSLYHYDRTPIFCRAIDTCKLSAFASRFADYFLIPQEALQELLGQLGVKIVRRPEDVVRLAPYFGVSFGAMCQRLQLDRQLDISTPELQQVKPMALAQMLGYYQMPDRKLNCPLPPEERLPRIFLELTYKALQSRKISLRRAAELLGISDIELSERLYPDDVEVLEEAYA